MEYPIPEWSAEEKAMSSWEREAAFRERTRPRNIDDVMRVLVRIEGRLERIEERMKKTAP